MSTVTMQELELETAELLPARETLWCPSGGGGHNSTNIVGSGDGNTAQYAQGGGFLSPAVNVSALNGNLDGDGNFIL